MSKSTFLYDGEVLLTKFYMDTTDGMSNADFDIDEILSYYPSYLKDPSVPERFRYRSKMNPLDGDVLVKCVLELYRRLDWTFGALRKDIALKLTTINVDRVPQSARPILVVRIYNENERDNPRITEPPRDH